MSSFKDFTYDNSDYRYKGLDAFISDLAKTN